MSLSPDSVRGGASSQGTVTLAFPDTRPHTVLLFSGDTTVATVPATATIPAGATSVTFPIATNAAAPPTIVQIMASVGNTPRTANLSVNPATPAGPSLSSGLRHAESAGQEARPGPCRSRAGPTAPWSSWPPATRRSRRSRRDTVVDGGQAAGAFSVRPRR